MLSMEDLKELFNGRGFFASFLVISGWVYVLILIIVLIHQAVLLMFRGK